MSQTLTLFPPLPAVSERASLADSAYDTLLEGILSGQLPAGAELNAVTLAAQLEISRTPVQEAIRRLVADGLVEQENGRRARVVRLQPADIEEIYELRTMLEGAAAHRAATRIEPGQLAQLRQEAELLASTRHAVDWASRVIEFDIRFHQVLASASGNRRLAADIHRYRQLVRGLCRISGSAANLSAALDEHCSVLDALEARNGAAARRAMVEHIEARLAAVLREVRR